MRGRNFRKTRCGWFLSLENKMRKVLFLCLLLILLSTVWACKKTDEDRLVEYLKQAYPPEYAEHVKMGVLDSVYDPYDSLCTLLNIIDSIKDMPIMDAILHDNRKKANALGRNATIYESGGYTKNIVVIYDANGNIKHTSIQSEKKGEQIMSKFFQRYHRDPFWEEPPR